MFPLDYIADVVAPWSEDPKLIIRVIIFELTQHIHPRYINVTDGQADGWTDGRTTYDGNTAVVSRGNNKYTVAMITPGSLVENS